MDALRAAADEAESIVDEDYWPLPCYSRMLFYMRPSTGSSLRVDTKSAPTKSAGENHSV